LRHAVVKVSDVVPKSSNLGRQ